MAAINTEGILKQNKLRLTDGRKEVLAVLQSARHALLLAEIEKKLPSMDRITMYRTLQSFRKKELIHVISDPQSGIIRYMYNDPNLPKQHAHFKCTLCSKLICLDKSVDPVVAELPDGYEAETYSLVIEGLCNKCSL
jgi:Fur family transcriptional regulator, ferric uptake regulator